MPGSREYPERPIVGIGVVVWRGNDVLLVRRGKPPRAGDWSLPGGAQEIGERAAEAAVREVREETGVEIRVTDLIDVVDGIGRDAEGRVRHHYTLVEFRADWMSGTLQPGDDAAEARWVPRGRLGDYDLWNETLRIIEESARLARRTPPR
jgi:ADP-ribose pyrophosphatase YjhB (NUDIX family)